MAVVAPVLRPPPPLEPPLFSIAAELEASPTGRVLVLNDVVPSVVTVKTTVVSTPVFPPPIVFFEVMTFVLDSGGSVVVMTAAELGAELGGGALLAGGADDAGGTEGAGDDSEAGAEGGADEGGLELELELEALILAARGDEDGDAMDEERTHR